MCTGRLGSLCSFPRREGGKPGRTVRSGLLPPRAVSQGVAVVRRPGIHQGSRGPPGGAWPLSSPERCLAFTCPPCVLGAPEIGRAQGPSSLPAWGPALGTAAGRLRDLCLQGPDRPPEGGRGSLSQRRAREACCPRPAGAGSACGCRLCMWVCARVRACV